MQEETYHGQNNPTRSSQEQEFRVRPKRQTWFIYGCILMGVLLICIFIFRFLWQTLSESENALLSTSSVPTTIENDPTNPNAQVENSSTSTPGLYRNEEWGFEFEYPSDWKILSPVFGSSASLFNFGINDPARFLPITVNITPKEWIEQALEELKDRGVETQSTTVDNLTAVVFEDTDWLGRPATVTLVLVKNEYWIDITGVHGYEDTYNHILDSFRFIE